MYIISVVCVLFGGVFWPRAHKCFKDACRKSSSEFNRLNVKRETDASREIGSPFFILFSPHPNSVLRKHSHLEEEVLQNICDIYYLSPRSDFFSTVTHSFLKGNGETPVLKLSPDDLKALFRSVR